ncbi:MAG: hypothetical protein ACFFCX_08040 [Candidatus Sifarchaeia archaeon]
MWRVFLAVFGWSWMFFQVPNREQFLSVFGFSVLYSLIFGLIVTSGMKKTKSRERKGKMVAGSIAVMGR